MNIVYCRNGIRRVLLIGRWALKFPNVSNCKGMLIGLMSNMTEREFATMNMPECAPILFSLPGGWLNVMPRADVKRADDPDRFLYLDLFEAMLETSDNAPILRNIVEMKIDSIGLLDGRVVAIDYGS